MLFTLIVLTIVFGFVGWRTRPGWGYSGGGGMAGVVLLSLLLWLFFGRRHQF
jgi:Na+/melibiose symporter-like transporter